MKFPCITIDAQKLQYNAANLKNWLAEHQLTAHWVTKGVCAYESIVKLLAEAGVEDFADARLENLAVLKPYARTTLLTRLPMISEVNQVVRLADISLNSEPDTIYALSDAAVAAGVVHGVILMVEMGDLREGMLPGDVLGLVHRIMNLRGVKLLGLGVNFNCFGGVIPTAEKINEFAELTQTVQDRYFIKLQYISGGNSGSLHLLEGESQMSPLINHLRIGEGYLLGRETSFGHRILDLHQDVFRFHCEVIENKRKGSVPDGLTGFNYRGEDVQPQDLGTIRRVILACGDQDIDWQTLTPYLRGLDYLGSSSDHAIFNASDLNRELAIGDQVEFSLAYSSLMRAFASPYIEKVMI